METTEKNLKDDKGFDPLQMIGFFWLFFGIVIMLATFFIKATPRVPLSHGIITNVTAAALLIVTGGLCILKAKRHAR